MTCGVRRLLSLLLGLGILLNWRVGLLGEKPNNVKQTGTAAVTWSAVHHPTWWKNNKETFIFGVKRQTVWAAFMFRYHINNA